MISFRNAARRSLANEPMRQNRLDFAAKLLKFKKFETFISRQKFQLVRFYVENFNLKFQLTTGQ